MNKKMNSKGVTLFELIASILVGSIVITMLMQQLLLAVEVKRNFDLENRMEDQAYIISEKIKKNVFDLQPHSIEVTTVGTQTIVNIYHHYDITVGTLNEIVRDCTNEVVDQIIWDSATETLTYVNDGVTETLHAGTIGVVSGTVLEVIQINSDYCTTNPPLPRTDFCDPAFTPEDETCYKSVLRLELHLTINGTDEIRTYESTIII